MTVPLRMIVVICAGCDCGLSAVGEAPIALRAISEALTAVDGHPCSGKESALPPCFLITITITVAASAVAIAIAATSSARA
jgi:hypothetical protein